MLTVNNLVSTHLIPNVADIVLQYHMIVLGDFKYPPIGTWVQQDGSIIVVTTNSVELVSDDDGSIAHRTVFANTEPVISAKVSNGLVCLLFNSKILIVNAYHGGVIHNYTPPIQLKRLNNIIIRKWKILSTTTPNDMVVFTVIDEVNETMSASFMEFIVEPITYDTNGNEIAYSDAELPSTCFRSAKSIVSNDHNYRIYVLDDVHTKPAYFPYPGFGRGDNWMFGTNNKINLCVNGEGVYTAELNNPDASIRHDIRNVGVIDDHDIYYTTHHDHPCTVRSETKPQCTEIWKINYRNNEKYPEVRDTSKSWFNPYRKVVIPQALTNIQLPDTFGTVADFDVTKNRNIILIDSRHYMYYMKLTKESTNCESGQIIYNTGISKVVGFAVAGNYVMVLTSAENNGSRLYSIAI